MNHLSKIVAFLILAVNALFAGILVLAAYSPYIDPAAHPVQSCMGLAFPVFLVINFCFLVFWLIVRWRYVVLSLLAFALCYPQIRTYMPTNFHSRKIPEKSIKVLSYNVMSFGNMKKEDGRNPILDYIIKSDVDIVCLQEHVLWEGGKKNIRPRDVGEALKVYPFQDVRPVGQEGGTNKLACYSRYPILSARVLDYESSYNGSVIYEIKINEDTVTLINNHLESNKLTKEDKVVYEDMLKDPDARKVKSGTRQLVRKLAEASVIRSAQADTIARAIRNTPHRYVIVCGDFNDSPISYAHRVISENLDDAFTQSGWGFGISYNQNKFYFRIDNILLSKNLQATNCTVDRSIKDSDHYPIWCYVSKR